jgi:hypothetical protein
MQVEESNISLNVHETRTWWLEQTALPHKFVIFQKPEIYIHDKAFKWHSKPAVVVAIMM